MGALEDGNKELTSSETPLSRAKRIENALKSAFAPETLTVEDQSARHKGHAGARPEGETHFAVRLVSARFEGVSRVDRQRAVNDALKGEFASGLHALSLDLKTPGEAR